ncbi:MAG: PAS domain-containing protein [Eubacterium sp.]|nr:PAS domain-containing protein [Eubacterium sp.]
MDRVRNYLKQALEMTRSCVVVMKYTLNEPVSRTKLEFVSDNVQQLGMNLASLQGGFRLPKDYIHPEDRNGFIDAVSLAAETRTDFTYHVRLVGDDGVVRPVDIRSLYMEYDEDYYLIEYIFQEIVQTGDGEAYNGRHEGERKSIPTKDVFREEEMSELFGCFANAYGLYSTIVDQEGHALIQPVGPDAYLGYYYDMFERPENREIFEAIKRTAMLQDEAVYSELGDGNPDSRVSAVPLVVNGVYLATWMLCAHDKSQTASLRIASREQYHLGELISGYIQRAVIAGKRGESEAEIEKQLEFEIRQKKLLAELQDVMRGNEEDRLHVILSRAAEHLDVDYAFFSLSLREDQKTVTRRDHWSPDGNDSMSALQMDRLREHFTEEEWKRIRKEGCVIDQESMTNRMRVTVFQGMARAVMLMPASTGKEEKGKVCFLESRKERVWSDSEIHFARLIGRMLAETTEIIEMEAARRKGSQTLLSIFHQLTIDVFIRENESGKVLFVNEAMTKHLGMDITGHDSRRLIPGGKEDYESYPGTIHETSQPMETRTWQRYINELGGIYNVTEIPIEWMDGRPATAVLLRSSGN